MTIPTQIREREAVLCYVEDHCAYFTTQPLAEQWGDDWDDAPYEHNAGQPYLPHKSDRDKGKDWKIHELYFSGPFQTPCEGTPNSHYSVQQINGGAVAWLVPERWAESTEVIRAGVTMTEFKRIVKAAGGKVFEPVSEDETPPAAPPPVGVDKLASHFAFIRCGDPDARTVTDHRMAYIAVELLHPQPAGRGENEKEDWKLEMLQEIIRDEDIGPDEASYAIAAWLHDPTFESWGRCNKCQQVRTCRAELCRDCEVAEVRNASASPQSPTTPTQSEHNLEELLAVQEAANVELVRRNAELQSIEELARKLAWALKEKRKIRTAAVLDEWALRLADTEVILALGELEKTVNALPAPAAEGGRG